MSLGADGGRAAAPGEGGRGEPIHPLIELYRLYERKLFSQCLTQLRNPIDAEDAVQETFARAARHLDQLEDDPEPYLATVARNVCRDEMQRRARCIATGDADLFGELEVGHPETSTIDRDQLNAAWKRFTTRERQLIGRQFAGFSYEEIAGHLNMTPGALNVALARARKRARQIASVTVTGALAILGLRRLAGRSMRGGGGVVMPSALLTATALTCVVVGVTGGSWLGTQPGRAAAAAGSSQLTGLPQPPPAHPASVAAAASAADRLAGTAAAGTAAGGRAGGHTTVADVAASVVSPGQDATQEDAGFTSVTPSPAYQRDHTVFASGTLANGCGRPTCPVIFWTRDGGASWQQLVSSGFLGGKLLLSPAYPVDPIMFASGPAGLQRSDDGGAHFSTVVPGPAPAAVDPQSPVGAARVFVAAQVPVVYDAATKTAVPGPALPAGVTSPNDVAYGSEGDVIMTANQLDASAPSLQDGVVIVCPNQGGCRVTLVDPNQPVLNVTTSVRGAGVSGATFIWSTTGVRVSKDDGASFAVVAVPSGRQVHALAMAANYSANPRLVLAIGGAGGRGDQVAQSLNGGATFAATAASGLGQVITMAVLADGHELAAVSDPAATTGFGIRCSADGGVNWALSC